MILTKDEWKGLSEPQRVAKVVEVLGTIDKMNKGTYTVAVSEEALKKPDLEKFLADLFKWERKI